MSDLNMEELDSKINSTRTRIAELSQAGEATANTVKNLIDLANSAQANTEALRKEMDALKQTLKASFGQLLMGLNVISDKSAQSMTLVNALLMYMVGYDTETAKTHLRNFFAEQEKKAAEMKKILELRKTSNTDIADKEADHDPIEDYMTVRANRLKVINANFDGDRFWNLLDLLTVADSMGQEPSLQKLEAAFGQFDAVQQEYEKRVAVKTAEYIPPASNVVELKPKV